MVNFGKSLELSLFTTQRSKHEKKILSLIFISKISEEDMETTEKLSDVLARKRTELAAQRTVMAADRSLMAWVRTGLSLIGFGFSIYAFLQSVAIEKQLPISDQAPRRIGLFLLALGIVSIILGVLQDWITVRNIKKTYDIIVWRFTLLIAAIIGLLGVLLFVLVFIKVRVG